MKELQGQPMTRPPRTPVAYDIYDRDEPRTNTSTRRYVGQASQRTIMRVTAHQGPPPIQRASRMNPQTEQPQPVATRKQASVSRHWLFYGGVSLFLMLSGWVLLSMIGNWWNGMQDDWHYGRPRTVQYDVNVGHGGVSHFTVENLQGHIFITEVQVGDPAKAKIYVGPVIAGPGAELQPATLTFADVNGDGMTDMVLTVDNTQYIFLNGKDGFHLQSLQGYIYKEGGEA